VLFYTSGVTGVDVVGAQKKKESTLQPLKKRWRGDRVVLANLTHLIRLVSLLVRSSCALTTYSPSLLSTDETLNAMDSSTSPESPICQHPTSTQAAPFTLLDPPFPIHLEDYSLLTSLV